MKIFIADDYQSATPKTAAWSKLAGHDVTVCTDTLKRILVREGIADFPGAKYVISPAREAKTWTRPCLRCRAVSTRPRFQFLCDPCKAEDADDDTYYAHLPYAP